MTGHLALQRAYAHALAHLDALDTMAVAPRAPLAGLRAALDKPLPARGLAAETVIDELVRDAAPGMMGSQSGRFFAWVIGGGLPSAIAADWLTSVWDQNAGIHACSPAASVVEEVAGQWLCELFDLPQETSFGLTTGTQMAHVTCLAAARHALLAARGWDVERKGLCGAPRLRILANADRHGSVDRAVRLLGFGSDSIESLSVDADGRVTPAALTSALGAGDAPAIVVLQAGELNLAAFDPFEALAPIARAAGAWVHVDGAFGLWAKACAAKRELVRGIELCDSWTTDAHKVLNVPYDCGIALVRDRHAHRAAMTLSTSYLPAGEARDQIDWNPEFSRRARGFTVYAALRELGRDGLDALVARLCRHAATFAARLAGIEGAEVIAPPAFNQLLVRFRDDAATEAVMAEVNASGEAFFGGVTWRGRRAMRISVCNWRTDDADVERAVAAIARACGRRGTA